jgi:hypothetical protein
MQIFGRSLWLQCIAALPVLYQHPATEVLAQSSKREIAWAREARVV